MPETDSPLLTLCRRLLCLGPPSIKVLIARLEDAREYEDFVALVREFLPEREGEILHQPSPDLQIATFASHFESRYFPLHGGFSMGAVEGYYDLLRGIPVVLMSVSWDDYHEIAGDYRPGIQLMTYLLANPYESLDGNGARIALAEACEVHVPRGLLQQVPEGGLSTEEAHRLLDGTRHEGLARWGGVLTQDTGSFFLDVTDDELCSGELPPWERAAVEDLTSQWRQAEAIQEKVMALAEWLEKKPRAHFGELLDFIEQRRREVNDALN